MSILNRISNIVTRVVSNQRVRRVSADACIAYAVCVEFEEIFNYLPEEIIEAGITPDELFDALAPYFNGLGFELDDIAIGEDGIDATIKLPFEIAFENQRDVEASMDTIDENLSISAISDQYQLCFLCKYLNDEFDGSDDADGSNDADGADETNNFNKILAAQKLFAK